VIAFIPEEGSYPDPLSRLRGQKFPNPSVVSLQGNKASSSLILSGERGSINQDHIESKLHDWDKKNDKPNRKDIQRWQRVQEVLRTYSQLISFCVG
jgi:hypothetical protein